MYAQCLRKLERVEDNVQVSLKLLGKLVQRDRRAWGLEKRLPSLMSRSVPSTSSTSKILQDLLSNSMKLSTVVRAPIDKHFQDATLSPYLRHLPNHGGFELDLVIRQHMTDVLEINEIKVKLASVAEKAVSETWLQSRGTIKLQRGKSSVPLVSSVCSASSLPLCSAHKSLGYYTWLVQT